MTVENTDSAIERMLNGDEPQVEAAPAADTAEVTNEGSEETKPDAESGKEPAQEDGDLFSREYVTELRKENARYRTEAKEAREQFSELEKQINELTTEHKAEIEKNSLEIARWKVAAKYGISAEDVELFLTASDEETLEKQAERLSQTSTHAPKPDAAQGTRNSTGPATTKQQGAAALEGLFN